MAIWSEVLLKQRVVIELTVAGGGTLAFTRD